MIRAIQQKFLRPNTFSIRLGVLAGLVVGLMGIGLLTSRIQPGFVLIAVVGVPVILLAVSWLEFGVLAIILTAGFVRFSIGTGTESRLVASLLVTALFIALWIVQMLVRRRRLCLKPSRTNVPLMAFILTVIISYGWSNAFRDPLVVVWSTWPLVQLGGLAVMVLLPGAFLLTANVVSGVRWLTLLNWSMILIGTLAFVDHFLPIRISFLNTGGLFSLWFVSLTYAQALFNKRLPWWVRLILLGLMLAWMYVYSVEQVTWLSGWLPSLAAIAVISLLKSKRVLLVLVLLMAIYIGMKWDYYTGSVWAAEREESGDTRLAAWQQNWTVTREHILFGTGPAGYAAYYMSYFPTTAMATHSNYIDILSQTGIVGLVFCLWFLVALGWTGYELCVRLKGTGDFSEGFAAAALAGCAGCIMAMGLGDWMFPFVYTQTIAGFDYAVYSWVLLGGIVVLANLHPPSEATDV